MPEDDSKGAPTAGLDEFLTGEFSSARPGARFLFTCRFTKILKLNILLLRLFLQGRGERGIYVSIDRPHGYTQHSLKALGVPQDGLIYIDAISRLTGQRAEDSQVRFLADGFTLPLLDDLFSRAYLAEGVQKHFVKMEELGFILLDNVQVMTQYLPTEKAKRILEGLGGLVRRYTAMRTVFVVDPGSNPELCAFLRGRCDRELPVREEWL
ncbi:MAG: hypothetical protein FJ149_01690 [Euryarchaeota archaeon]|nr:hypothetical protein [Euryarchaeota archaeon]